MSNFINLDTPFFDNVSGEPLALGTAYFGEPNLDPKTNPKTPYTSLNPNVASTATQALTSAGKLSTRLYLLGDYSLTVDDADGNQILNYDSVKDDSELQAWILFPQLPTQTSATTFTVTGDQTTTFTAGERLRFADSTTLYGIVRSSVYTSLTTVTVTLDSGSLSGSLTEVYTSSVTTSGKEVTTASVTHLDTRISTSIVYDLDNLIYDTPLSIKLLGAVLNDSSSGARSTNDVAIQAALDFCYNSGGTVAGEVYIPAGGIYYTSTTLNHKGTVCISGAGIFTSTINSSAATCMQADTTAGASDFKIEKLTLIGAGVGYSDNGKNIARSIFDFCILDGGADGYGYLGSGLLISCVWRDCVISQICKISSTGAMNNNKFENVFFNRSGTMPTIENGEVFVIEGAGVSSALMIDTCVIEIGSMRIDATSGTWYAVDLNCMWIGDGPTSPRSELRLNNIGQMTMRNLSMETHILNMDGCIDVTIDNVRAWSVDTGDGFGSTNRMYAKGLIVSDNSRATETSGNLSEIVFEGDVYGTGLPVVRHCSIHFDADALASDEWDRVIAANTRNGVIRRCAIIPEATITATPTHYAQLKIKPQGGGLTTDTASFDVESITSGTIYEFDVSTNNAMRANTTVIFEKTVQGSGMLLPAMTVILEYEDRGW